MEKIVIVTLQSVNIGNRLQNYALQTVLEKNDYEVVNPKYYANEFSTKKKRFKHCIKVILGIIGIKKFADTKLAYYRKRKFDSFDRKYIKNHIYVEFDNVAPLGNNSFLCALSGSDQVWHNWSNRKEELEYFYLNFIPESKRISYAASFGFEKFPEKDLDYHIKGIKGIKYLSCREEGAKKLIKEISDRDAKVVLDPTLLLNCDDWKKLGRKPDYQLNDDYILVYCLGEKNNEFYDSLKIIDPENQYQIIDIYNINKKDFYLTDPNEFIWLINHAKYVLTDSFHAVVFSLIFHRQFIVFRRYFNGVEDKMFDRITTLLNMFDASNFIYNKKSLDLEYDYDIFEKKIDLYRKDSLDFILNAIDNCKCENN